MSYFKIDGKDYSLCVNELKIKKNFNYNAQTNANGDTVVDKINSKREIEVGIIPLDEKTMMALQLAINAFSVSISFRNPMTNEVEEDVPCIIPSNGVEYYTIQAGKVMFKAFSLTFQEL